jgi:HNH endonuclease
MKEINLTQGRVALVDDWNYDFLNQFKWYATFTARCGKWYARRKISLPDGTRRAQLMHRVIMGEPMGRDIDHRDGDGLNNVVSNLRVATRSQNMQNRPMQKNNTSGFKGVTRFGCKWQSQIWLNGKLLYLGRFNTTIEAAAVWNWAARKLHGEFAYQNEF